MQLYQHKIRHKKYNKRRARKSLQNRLRGAYNLYLRKKQYNNYPANKRRLRQLMFSYQIQRIRVPEDFRLMENTVEVLKFVERVREHYRNGHNIFVNMSYIKKIDYPAELLLVALLNRFKNKHLDVAGNYPHSIEIHSKILSSDFFKHLSLEKRDKIVYTIGKANQIFAKAEKKVVSELPAMIIKDYFKRHKIPTDKEHLLPYKRGLTRAIIELMQNTHNHASNNPNEKEWWWMSQNEYNGNLAITFLDLGIGIIKSIESKKKWKNSLHYLINKFGLSGEYSPVNIVQWLLDGKLHKYTYDKYYRGKGLPGIKDALDKGYLNEFKIITNNVFADVKNRIFKKLSFELKGTLVYFEIKKL